jgi:hypothetical protein
MRRAGEVSAEIATDAVRRRPKTEPRSTSGSPDLHPETAGLALAAPKSAPRNASRWIAAQGVQVRDEASFIALDALAEGFTDLRSRALVHQHTGALAVLLCRMDPATRAAVLTRIKEDLETCASRAPSVDELSAWLDDARLPPELRLTAHLHLPRADVDSLAEVISRCHSHGAIRELRDVVFACVEHDRRDLILSAIEGVSAKQEYLPSLHEVSQAFRQRTLSAHALALALTSNPTLTPIAIDVRSALVKLGVDVSRATDEGLAEVEGWLPEAERLKAHVLAYAQAHGPREKRRFIRASQVLVETLQEIVEGRWPAARYEGSIAEQLLQGLSDASCSAWREVFDRTYSTLVRFDESNWSSIAMQLQELGARAQELALAAGIRVDQARLEELEVQKIELVNARASNREIGPVMNELNLLRFILSPKTTPSDAAGVEAMFAAASAGVSAAKHHRFADLAAALAALHPVVKAATDASVSKVRVVDSDAPWAFLKTFVGERCLVPGNASSSGLIGYIANADTRHLLAYKGDKLVARSLMFVRPIRTRRFEGRALFLDYPLAPNTGSAAPDECVSLIRAALDKAKLMNVPLAMRADFIDGLGAPEPETKQPLLALLGSVKAKKQEASFVLDPGRSPVMYHQWFKLWALGDKPRVRRYAHFIVMPEDIPALD